MSPTLGHTLDIARSTLGFYAPGPPRNSPYGAWTGQNPAPFCDSWVSWVFDQAGFTDFGKQAYVPATVNYWRRRGRLFTNPEPGDQVMFFWNGQFAHTGLVEAVRGPSAPGVAIVTLEANTSAGPADPNGGKVLRKVRTNAPRTVYGRPEYSAEPAAAPAVPFGINPPLVMRPIVAEWSPPDGGLVLIADNGDVYGVAGANYTGPIPLPLDQLPAGVARHDPQKYEPIVDALRSPGGGVWLLAASGAIYGNAHYFGGANGQEYFKGRIAARLEAYQPEGYAVPGYLIVATSGEKYGFV